MQRVAKTGKWKLFGLLFIGEGEDFEQAGVAISVVIFLLLVAAVGQQVPRRVPGHSDI